MTDNVVRLPIKEIPASSGVEIPEFITPKDIDAMNDDQLDAMIAAIRTRRMNSYTVYKQTVAEKNAINEEKAKIKVDKKCDQIIRKLNTIDKQMDDLEKFVAELRGLRLQAGMQIL